MAYTEVPDSVRIVLLILTAISFIPQLRRLYSKKNSLGLSPSYVLCNLIVATEQFAIIFYMMISVPEAFGNSFVHDPHTVGDWVNFAQIIVTWILFLAVYELGPGVPPSPYPDSFILTITYRPAHRAKCGYVAIYIIYLLISLVPLELDQMGLTPHLATPSWPENDLREAWAFTHGLFLNTLMPPLALIALIPQAVQIWKHIGDPVGYPGLSVWDLVIQSGVFGSVAVSWIWRVSFTGYSSKFDPGWFWDYGWPVVENGVVAGVQAVLALLAGWRGCVGARKRGREQQDGGFEEPTPEDRERQPLLPK
ncbi:hypothetical protein BJY01DRAFT_253794 [Aspergillus pseudoustus]|uniref:Uncharacterized protein n=1 Tax=Aspergillus pseudoustus TaxID=1810923 RepID=A0ABR4IY33_9EURO